MAASGALYKLCVLLGVPDITVSDTRPSTTSQSDQLIELERQVLYGKHLEAFFSCAQDARCWHLLMRYLCLSSGDSVPNE
jgi:hypothetical protein